MTINVYIVEEDMHVAALYARVVRSLGANAEVVNPVAKILNMGPALVHGLVVLDMGIGEGRVLAVLGHLSQNANNVIVGIVTDEEDDVVKRVKNRAAAWGINVAKIFHRPKMLSGLREFVKENKNKVSVVHLEQVKEAVIDSIEIDENDAPYFAEFTEAELNEAISSNDITPWYQPIIDINKCEVVGLEALVRWQHPSIGVIPPNDFLNQIESYGMMENLTHHVFEKTLSLQKRAISYGFRFNVSINVQTALLKNTAFLRSAKRMLNRANIDADTITLEISDWQSDQEKGELLPIMQQVRDVGLGLSLDDITSDTTGLTELTRLPITQLNIDSELIWAAVSNDDALGELCTVAAVFHDTGINTIAEGIENKDMMAMVKVAGITHGQGYLWSPAVPRAQLAKKVRAINSMAYEDTGDNFGQDTLPGMVLSKAS